MPHDLKRLPRPVETAAAEAARLGEELREARLALGHGIEDLAQRLRIRRAHLEALEQGRVKDLPGAAYAVGFVRSYAAALGLDADDMARRFREITGQAAPKPKLVFPEPAPERAMPAGALMAAGTVFAIGAYVAWFNWSGGGDRTVDVVPPVPPRLEQAAELGRSQIPAPAPGPLPLAVLPPPGGAPGVVTTPGANTSAQAATVPAAPSPPPTPPAPAPAPVAAAPATPPPAPAAAPAADGTRIVLRARAGSGEGAWIQVRDPRTGQSLVNRVLRPGETWSAPVRDGLVLDTGKAEALEILLDGQPQPTLEGVVGVRRAIALDPERLRQRLVPPAATASPTRN